MKNPRGGRRHHLLRLRFARRRAEAERRRRLRSRSRTGRNATDAVAGRRGNLRAVLCGSNANDPRRRGDCLRRRRRSGPEQHRRLRALRAGSRGRRRWSDLGQAPPRSLLRPRNQRPELAGVRTTFDASVPQYKIDRRSRQGEGARGSDRSIFDTMQSTFGSLYVNDFTLFGRNYQVNLQSEGELPQRPTTSTTSSCGPRTAR